MNRFVFTQTQTVTSQFGVIAKDMTDAMKIAQRRHGNSTLSLDKVQILAWKPQRRTVALGAWFNDEYEREYSDLEELEECETFEQAVEAIKDAWGFEEEFIIGLDGEFVASDYSKMIHKEYVIRPVTIREELVNPI